MDLLPTSITSNPSLAPLIRLIEEIDRGTSSHHGSTTCEQQQHRHKPLHPRIDLVELPGSFRVYVELPGAKKRDITVELTDPKTLVVKGSVLHSYREEGATGMAGDKKGDDGNGGKRSGKEGGGGGEPTYLISERGVGSFTRMVRLPIEVQREGIEAGLQDGVLVVKIEKPAGEVAGAKRIEIL